MHLPKHATVVSYVALFIALGGTAYAATGGNFLLGNANKADQTTSLKNTGTGPALKLTTADGTTAPLAVSNGTKITHLNADKLDGLDSSALEPKAVRISHSQTSNDPDSHVATAGPWTVTLKCSATGFTRITIHGQEPLVR